MRTPILHCLLAAMLGWLAASCQSTPDAAAAVDIAAKVLAGDRGDGVIEVWIVDARTGKKLESLMDGVSRSMLPVFSPDKSWLIVEDEVVDGFRSVRLFHAESDGGFRRIPEEDFLFGLLQQFYSAHGLNEGNLRASAVTLGAWAAEGKSLRLDFAATRLDGSSFKKSFTLDLARLE